MYLRLFRDITGSRGEYISQWRAREAVCGEEAENRPKSSPQQGMNSGPTDNASHEDDGSWAAYYPNGKTLDGSDCVILLHDGMGGQHEGVLSCTTEEVHDILISPFDAPFCRLSQQWGEYVSVFQSAHF